MSMQKIVLLLGIVVVAVATLPDVHAFTLSLTLSPDTQTVPQYSVASYLVGIAGASGGSYSMTPVGGEVAEAYFNPNPVSTGATVLRIETSSIPSYCPGTHRFAVLPEIFETTVPP